MFDKEINEVQLHLPHFDKMFRTALPLDAAMLDCKAHAFTGNNLFGLVVTSLPLFDGSRFSLVLCLQD